MNFFNHKHNFRQKVTKLNYIKSVGDFCFSECRKSTTALHPQFPKWIVIIGKNFFFYRFIILYCVLKKSYRFKRVRQRTIMVTLFYTHSWRCFLITFSLVQRKKRITFMTSGLLRRQPKRSVCWPVRLFYCLWPLIKI